MTDSGHCYSSSWNAVGTEYMLYDDCHTARPVVVWSSAAKSHRTSMTPSS